ncbi:30S ribosomal protein S4 [Micromonospora sp. 4G57]|jgi:small subunit ribosomal protein S4|uniref:30S ribosomal protein S4 n=1 Tax=Micromonospora sicca TaxID=2202420 RepID=A0ABU5JHE6_9ACTN|nr:MULTISPECIES: 30S ribosomal protein S4 [unclassified Micromonospora]MDZ5447513.1 30S ribosomal protein S4 [Micromonospora sp. 4G57]MDZ5492016.1 30S ribosomal protein S4 [Micromonospora sp. 4G53]
MAVRTTVRPSPEDIVPLHPAHGYRLRRQRHPVGVRGGPRRAPRGYRLDDAQRHHVRAAYELRERQLARALTAAGGQPGDAAENLVGQLEQRMDALVHRAGFARSMDEARDLVAHNTFTVDGGKVNRSSYLVRPGQTIRVRPERQCRAPVAFAVAGYAEGDAPPYLEVRPERFTATLTREPQRQEVPVLRDLSLAVHEERRTGS